MNLFEKLKTAGLPVISVSADNNIAMGEMTVEQEEVYRLLIMEHFKPEEHNNYINFKSATAQLKQEYIQAVQTLTQIKDATNPTSSQIVQAIKYMAKILLFLLKIVARHYIL